MLIVELLILLYSSVSAAPPRTLEYNKINNSTINITRTFLSYPCHWLCCAVHGAGREGGGGGGGLGAVAARLLQPGADAREAARHRRHVRRAAAGAHARQVAVVARRVRARLARNCRQL